jgi:LacI family transcriptional regulator
MAGRPTIADLAREAGVSVATVDRVLNGRHRVREDTSRRVFDAATAIGFHAAGLIRQRLQKDLPQYRFGFLLRRPGHYFYKALAGAIETAVKDHQGFRGLSRIEFVDSPASGAMAEAMKQAAAQCDAIAAVSVDHASLSAGVMELRERGVPVFSLLSDFALGIRSGYVGVDNGKAGRTAAWAIAKTARRSGKVAAFVGSHRFVGHEMREMGFRSYFREHAPEFELLDTLVNLEETGIAHEATLDLLERHPDLVGLCIIGGGMEGAIGALREAGRAGRISVVCNELTPESRAALADQLVTVILATPIEALANKAVELLLRAVQSKGADVPGQTFLPFSLHGPENI